MERNKELLLAFNFNKRGQVAIFIIIGILLVVAIILIFIFWKSPDIDRPSPFSPSTYISSCVKDSAKKAIPILSENGGSITPKNGISYRSKNFAYLCYNANYYESCVNQQPMLIEHMEEEITEYIRPEVKDCFSGLQRQLESQGYQVSLGPLKIETELRPNRIVVTTNRKITISKGEDTRSFTDFETKFPTALYEFGDVATEIVNQETGNCGFDTLTFMLMHPEYDVRKKVVEDSNLYTLKSLETGEEFKFATRSCAMPPGI